MLCSINLETPVRRNEGLIYTDKKLEAYSCYVELHRKSISNTGEPLYQFYMDKVLIIRTLRLVDTRNTSKCWVQFYYTYKSHPVGINGRNNIVVMTPMKFLPIEEFEKRQKSINPSNTLAITSSMISKVGFQAMWSPSYIFDWLLKTKIRKQTLLKIRKRPSSWKKRETMH